MSIGTGPLGTSLFGDGWYNISLLSGSNSVVECDLAKVEVAGSNPVSRSRNYAPFLVEGLFLCTLFLSPVARVLRRHGENRGAGRFASWRRHGNLSCLCPSRDFDRNFTIGIHRVGRNFHSAYGDR